MVTLTRLMRARSASSPRRMRAVAVGVTVVAAGLLSALSGVGVPAAQAAASVPIPAGVSKVPGLGNHVRPSCSGTGTDGNRVQVLYVRDASQPSEYASALPTIRDEVATVDDVFMQSARKTGGGRKVRWVHDANCLPVVQEVTVPDGTMAGGSSALIDALHSEGYNAPDRKYLAFKNGDSANMSDCGFAQRFSDSSPTGNRNDTTGGMIAAVERSCWAQPNRSTAAHELGHAFGAVQEDAPHAVPGGHCTDGQDLMCDGYGTTNASPDCPSTMLLDCHNDDYFSTDPTPGSYLATHWNIANSSYLDVVPDPAGPAATLTQSLTSTDSYDPVTFTVNTSAPVDVYWRSNNPSCITGGQRTKTVTIQCKTGQGTVTATAYVTGSDDGLTVLKGSYAVNFPSGNPTVTLHAPASAPAGQAFTITADVTGAPSPYTFDWAGNTQCTFTRPNADTVHPVCSYDPSHPSALFTVDVYDADGYYVAPGVVRVKVAPPGSSSTTVVPTLTIRASHGYPTRVTGTVANRTTGKPVTRARVRLQAQWSGTRRWVTLATDTSSRTGTVAYRYDTTRAGHFRLQTVRTTRLAQRTSPTAWVKVPVTASLAVEGHTLTAELRTGAGAAVGHARAALFERTVAGGWKQLGPAKRTGRTGQVSFPVRARHRTAFEIRFRATGTRSGATTSTRYLH